MAGLWTSPVLSLASNPCMYCTVSYSYSRRLTYWREGEGMGGNTLSVRPFNWPHDALLLHLCKNCRHVCASRSLATQLASSDGRRNAGAGNALRPVSFVCSSLPRPQRETRPVGCYSRTAMGIGHGTSPPHHSHPHHAWLLGTIETVGRVLSSEWPMGCRWSKPGRLWVVSNGKPHSSAFYMKNAR